MRVTSKGQVTVPQHVREDLGIQAGEEIDFEKLPDGGYRIVKAKPGKGGNRQPLRSPFRAARGSATVKMSTDEIMALARGEK
ncbi:hypothetical protein CAI21_04670 [Alkalilimnicola ehrlichii]|uniref:SpoVT-AbrB domain-containing protein n=1 Tax=Alkalilimnicola ehrlichii TaxID=351052 RepID=A0A3E0WZF9_9GAMM|nr:AbrB/MazE/SpoVT family DNA-binding domain-containing protein [Alkalilimnicola ehrlichii]RFA30803.1 hypothetical protein CAI21_04670 [Alkalilimnicola ehrlichii]RFA38418.1 hypothetical protein CAL65_06035 [Alkalilimnicola ehrlichii]